MLNHRNDACGGTVLTDLPPQASTLNINNNTEDNIMIIRFEAYFNGKRREFEITGQVAKTLLYLVDSGKAGITALEVSSWAFRLAAYVHILRSKYDLEIRTDKEPHQGGYHARYVLITPVEIIGVENS